DTNGPVGRHTKLRVRQWIARRLRGHLLHLNELRRRELDCENSPSPSPSGFVLRNIINGRARSSHLYFPPGVIMDHHEPGWTQRSIVANPELTLRLGPNSVR